MDTLADFGGLLLGLVLTLFIFSYIIKDNPLYKIAVHLLVGVSSGFATVVIISEVIAPTFQQIADNPADIGNLLWVIPIGLGLLLLLKAVPKLASLGNSSMAVLVAVGSSVALVGAVMGTLLPQIFSRYQNSFYGLIGAILTICTVLYFYFTFRVEEDSSEAVAKSYRYVRIVGRIVITMTLAAVFAGLLATSTVILTQRIGYFIDTFRELFEAL